MVSVGSTPPETHAMGEEEPEPEVEVEVEVEWR